MGTETSKGTVTSERSYHQLLDFLNRNHPVIIQTHDYPDHDAVAAGYALKHLLGEYGYCSELCYGGELQSETLADTIKLIDIPILPASTIGITDRSQIVLVDSFAGNKNVTDLSGRLVGIIDHHEPPEAPNCDFADIRKGYGSCSTIIHQYYLETGIEAPKPVATALLMGIMMDTAYMTRGVAPVDLAAFSGLFFKGDWELAAYILRNCLSIRDIPVIRYAIDNCVIEEDDCFLELDSPCRSELLGLLSDYLLSFKEIHFVATWELDSEECRISVRSEDPKKPADLVIRKVLEGIGYGGGHLHMSGGSIPLDRYPGAEGLRRLFSRVLADISKR